MTAAIGSRPVIMRKSATNVERTWTDDCGRPHQPALSALPGCSSSQIIRQCPGMIRILAETGEQGVLMKLYRLLKTVSTRIPSARVIILSLLLSIIVSGLFFWWMHEERRIAVAELTERGHYVRLDSAGGDIPWLAQKLEDLLGRERFLRFGVHFFSISHVTFNESPTLEKDVLALRSLPEVGSMCARGIRTCDDRVLQSLSTIMTLEAIDIPHCPVTDHGLACLSCLPRLQSLSVHSTAITGEPFISKRWASAETLERLGLSYTQLTFFSFCSLEQFSQLQVLDVSCCRRLQGDAAFEWADLPDDPEMRKLVSSYPPPVFPNLRELCFDCGPGYSVFGDATEMFLRAQPKLQQPKARKRRSVVRSYPCL